MLSIVAKGIDFILGVHPFSEGKCANARANITNAAKERDHRDTSNLSPVIDLKQLNAHIYAPPFHMHTISSVLNIVERGDYLFKIDLQDTYFHVLIHPDSRKYLCFAVKNKVYQFRVLPFRPNTSPQVSTRLVHTVAAYLYCQGILVIPYLENWLIHHPDCQILLLHQSQLLDTLEPGRPLVVRSEIRTESSSGYPVSGASITPWIRGEVSSQYPRLRK